MNWRGLSFLYLVIKMIARLLRPVPFSIAGSLSVITYK